MSITTRMVRARIPGPRTFWPQIYCLFADALPSSASIAFSIDHCWSKNVIPTWSLRQSGTSALLAGRS
jgi:hypothetical protein